jgi:hypothetical protein
METESLSNLTFNRKKNDGHTLMPKRANISIREKHFLKLVKRQLPAHVLKTS